MNKYNVIIAAVMLLVFAGCSGKNNEGVIEASGNIEAVNVIVSAKTGGEIVSLLKDEGTVVKTGDTIMIIDNENLMLQLNQALAGKDFADAQLELLKNGARKEDITQAEEMVNQTLANYNSAKKDKERMENLVKEKSITQKVYDDAVTRLQLTEAQYNAAKENYNKIKKFARPEEIKQAAANLNKNIASIDILKKSIRDSYVISPIDGIIVKKFVEKGETVPVLSSLFKVSNLKQVDLVIYVSETELGKVKLGQKAEVKVDAFEKNFYGVITYISPEAEFTPKNIQTKDERTKLVFAVKIKIDNPNFELKPGMPADARIIL